MPQASQVRTYDPGTSVVFLKTREKFGGLSNMAPGFPLQVNDIPIRTSEALYQACRFPDKPEIQRQIINEYSPMTAKMRSKSFRKLTRSDWNFVRVRIMRWCLQVKLAQNWQKFKNLLQETEGRPIVERSRKDDFWGAKIAEDGALVGNNVLGRLLMQLREQLKGDEAESLRFVKPPEIPDFLLFDQHIEPIQTSRTTGIPSSKQKRPQETESLPNYETYQFSLFDTPTIVEDRLKQEIDIEMDAKVIVAAKDYPS